MHYKTSVLRKLTYRHMEMLSEKYCKSEKFNAGVFLLLQLDLESSDFLA